MKKLPMIFQNDTTECGLAALAMILHFHGRFVKLTELRDKCSMSLSGISIWWLMKLAAYYQLSCKVLRIEVENIQQIHLPAILHWRTNHFVVLKTIKKNLLIVHDSARGRLRLTKDEFSRNFSGVVIECKPTFNFTPKKSEEPAPQCHSSGVWDQSQMNPCGNNISKSAWIKFFPIKADLAFKILLFAILYQLFLLILPRYLRLAMDNHFSIDKNLLLIITLGFVGLRAMATAAKALKTLCIHALDKHLNFYLGEKVCSHVMGLPLRYFEKHFISDILNRFNAVEQLRQIISSGLLEGFLGGLLAVVTLIIMFLISPLLGTVTFSFGFIYFIFRLFTLKYYKYYLFDMIAGKSREQMCFLENIRGIQPIKIFFKEEDRLNQWKKYYTQFLKSAYKNNIIKSSSEYVKEFLFGVEIIVITYLAVEKILPHFSMGIFYSYLFYRQQFCESLITFTEKVNDFKMLTLYRDRLGDLLEISKPPAAQALFFIPKNFTLIAKNISFGYSEFENPLLTTLNLSVAEGEIVVITGPSGSGKTTLLKILMGLIEPKEGIVTVDDSPVRNLSPGFLTAVMQEDCLLSGSLSDNISFFSEEKNMEKIIYCARLAGVLEEIFRMPLKFNTLVGDMGTTLSGGQKQRILLARALYTTPKILFLDEATSHLDIKKEREINRNIKALKITTIMIAHRPETIAMADRIIAIKP